MQSKYVIQNDFRTWSADPPPLQAPPVSKHHPWSYATCLAHLGFHQWMPSDGALCCLGMLGGAFVMFYYNCMIKSLICPYSVPFHGLWHIGSSCVPLFPDAVQVAEHHLCPRTTPWSHAIFLAPWQCLDKGGLSESWIRQVEFGFTMHDIKSQPCMASRKKFLDQNSAILP